MAKTLKELLKDIPEEQREDFLADPANRAAIDEATKTGTADFEKDALGNQLVNPSGTSQWIPAEQYPDYEADPANQGGTKGTDNISKSGWTMPKDNSAAYQESAAVQAARAALERLTAPSPYSSAWQSKLSEAADKVLNRQPFSYDYTKDPLYAAYRAEYQRLGRSAMEDMLGKASAYTGGYSNSYAESAANSAYLSYVSKLSDKLPELYQAALKRYDSETDAMYDEFDMLRSLENDEYSRYNASVSSYESEREYLAKLLSNEQNIDYKRYSDELDAQYKADTLAQKDRQAEAELTYKYEQAEADRKLALEKLEKELEYKVWKDRLNLNGEEVLNSDTGDETADGKDEGKTNNTRKLTLAGIKNDFYSLLQSQGSDMAFIYLEGLVSEERLSIQAARNVLSECGVLDVYLARKNASANSSGGGSGGSHGMAFRENMLM